MYGETETAEYARTHLGYTFVSRTAQRMTVLTPLEGLIYERANWLRSERKRLLVLAEGIRDDAQYVLASMADVGRYGAYGSTWSPGARRQDLESAVDALNAAEEELRELCRAAEQVAIQLDTMPK